MVNIKQLLNLFPETAEKEIYSSIIHMYDKQARVYQNSLIWAVERFNEMDRPDLARSLADLLEAGIREHDLLPPKESV